MTDREQRSLDTAFRDDLVAEIVRLREAVRLGRIAVATLADACWGLTPDAGIDNPPTNPWLDYPEVRAFGRQSRKKRRA